MVFQHETGECGLACVSMFCEALGSSVKLSELRHQFPVTASGASLMELTEILSTQGIATLAVKFAIKDFENLPLPAIVHFGGNHYVFVLERKGSYIRLFNPAAGRVIIHFDAVRESFTGYAIILDHTRFFSQPVIATSTAKKSKKSRLTTQLKAPYLKRIFVGSLCITGLSFLIPALYSQVLDKGGFPEVLGVYSPFIVVFFAVLLSAVTEMVLARLVMRQQAQLSAKYLPGLFGQLLQKEMLFFEKRSASDINQRFSSLNRVIVQSGQLRNTLAIALLTALISTLIMCWLHPLLGWLALTVILIYGLISAGFDQSREALHHAMENAASERNEFTYETINSIGLIKSANLFRERCARFAFKTDQVIRAGNGFLW